MNQNIVELKVDGMTCSHCAGSVTKFLKNKGLEDVYVNFSTKEVRFKSGNGQVPIEEVKTGIENLGYQVVEESSPKPWWTLEKKLLISAIFTFPLLLEHLLMMVGGGLPFMHNPWVQLAVCLPVYAIGFWHFGKSAWKSLKIWYPNMDVLIFTGSTAAFIYSILGTLWGEANYIFYETAAMIITLVLLGNWIEARAVEKTTTAIKDLSKLQVEKAKKIMRSGAVITVHKEEIHKGDLLQVNEGDKIPLDGIIVSGDALLDEAMLTGESLPVAKKQGDMVIGASVLTQGNIRMKVTATGKDTVLNKMIELVKTAQEDKPDIQRLADKISAIFVPAVLVISILTLLISWLVVGISFQQALMNSIAVLVISCPCAMGLATPTAVMVGVGRLAKNGILVKGGQTVEIFAGIKNFVFDKTGTLTTGDFKIKNIEYFSQNQKEINQLIVQLEQYSSHPIAKALVKELGQSTAALNGQFDEVKEYKGTGLMAIDKSGNRFAIGSYRIAQKLTDDDSHNIYLIKNDQLLATIDIEDQIKIGAKETIDFLKKQDFKPILLSGDLEHKTADVAQTLGIPTYYAQQLPKEKLDKIATISATAPTAMIGDGINDAPALAKADIGVSLGNASQVAIQSAQIVLLKNDMSYLKKAISISQHTLLTIKQNLFWAFAYNIVAIPIAAMGFLNPMWGALFMAFSDVVVIGNSIRLKSKKI